MLHDSLARWRHAVDRQQYCILPHDIWHLTIGCQQEDLPSKEGGSEPWSGGVGGSWQPKFWCQSRCLRLLAPRPAAWGVDKLQQQWMNGLDCCPAALPAWHDRCRSFAVSAPNRGVLLAFVPVTLVNGAWPVRMRALERLLRGLAQGEAIPQRLLPFPSGSPFLLLSSTLLRVEMLCK